MNNIAGPIFNESFVEKRVCGSREQYMGPTGKHWNALLNEKKAWNVDALRFSSIQTDTIHNNESFVINFIKLLMHYIYSIFSYFLFCFVFFFVVFFFFFAILTLFNFSSSLAIVILVQSFIPTNIYINFHLIPFRFLNIFLYIFLNSTVSICSTFHLLPPFLFHLNFHINLFLASLFPIPSKLSTTKMSVLYLFLQFCFSFGGFFFLLFQPLFFSY